MISADGKFLGWGDLYVLAAKYGAEIACLSYDNDEPELTPLRTRLCGLNGMPHAQQELDLSLHTTWLVGWCKANFERDSFQHLNHAIPLYSRAQIGDEWSKLLETWTSRHRQRVGNLMKQIQMFQDEDEDDQDVAILASLQERVDILEKKEVFFQRMFRMDLMPVDVLGDGNCLLRSILALRAGWNINKNLVTAEKIFGLRQASWFRIS